ncbi:hypothetical protein M9Y10_040870 [Tritrichomonas musculus]|uniref:Nucleoplasmin-like domain-containing protein n=1 Tax=Tritrichomonas musculus TaxID=1915356 RepID=A0ABR2K4M1_9EUKA
MSEEKIVTFKISEKEPLVIDFGGNESAQFHKVSIENLDKEHPTKLIAEFDAYTPDSVESGEPKKERSREEIVIFDGSKDEFEISYRPDAADNTKFIVDGPGTIIVHGQFGPRSAFLPEVSEEEEEEEEGKEE